MSYCVLTIQRQAMYLGSAATVYVTNAETQKELGSLNNGKMLVIRVARNAFIKFSVWTGNSLMFDVNKHVTRHEEIYNTEKTKLFQIINLSVSISMPFQYTVLSTGESESLNECCIVL
ncbi:MAG: hypothetical protein A3F40_00790 [Chlamydiae bacterium RIFCSPHIGHO2_12_FULL_27_8]|nr:MAG: hypothetical protein A3F40_00790 [Chlamydiae bacterium RIFCSPHIGHO2_12_FULL_27_8]OGN66663.1 MAG: hypothetical protein A2888_02250 [Chlamydiae bacterium RIFCSPLOWO2_01_FULL_28_7]